VWEGLSEPRIPEFGMECGIRFAAAPFDLAQSLRERASHIREAQSLRSLVFGPLVQQGRGSGVEGRRHRLIVSSCPSPHPFRVFGPWSRSP